MANLIFNLDDGQEIVVALTDKITIGRVDGNDVVVDDRRISGKHAIITRSTGGGYEVEDLGSKGGTYVNGKRVTKSGLTDGDLVGFGPLNGRVVLDLTKPVVTKATTPVPMPAAPSAAPSKPAPAVAKSRSTAPLSLPGTAPASVPPMIDGADVSAAFAQTDKTRETLDAAKPKKRGAAAKAASAAFTSAASVAASALSSAVSALDKAQGKDKRSPVEIAEAVSEELQARLEGLKIEVAETQETLQRYQAQRDEVQETLGRVLSQRDEADNAFHDKTSAVVKLRLEAQQIESRLQETQTNIHIAEQELNAKIDHIASLAGEESRLAEITAAIGEAVERQGGLESGIADLSARHDGQASALEQLQQEFAVVTEARGSAQATVDALNADRTSLEARLEELRTLCTAAEEKSGSLATLIETREGEARALETALESLGDQRSKLETAIAELSDSHEKLLKVQSEIAEADDRRTALDLVLVGLAASQSETESRISGLNTAVANLETLKTETAAALAALQESVATAKNNLVVAEATAEGRRLDLEKQQASLEAAAEARRVEIQKEKAELDASLEAHRVQLQKDKAELDAGLEAHRGQLQKDKAELDAGMDARRAEMDKAASDLEAAALVRKAELQKEKDAFNAILAGLHNDISTETSRLEDVKTERQNLDRQCQELAETEGRLNATRADLEKSEARRTELTSLNADLDLRQKELEKTVAKLDEDREALLGKMEVLRGREHDLKQELVTLSEREEKDRSRFEEISRLSADAEKEFADQSERIARSMAISTRELADLELKLTPLRQWKEDMDKRYERLASLPEDSADARDLWREIESEKSALSMLMGKKVGDSRGITLETSVLRGLTAPQSDESEGSPSSRYRRNITKGKLHAPEGVGAGDTPEERGNVGHTGTGAMLSGTGQEMALKARVTRLRESVQREATRLEFLRQERAREEARKQGQGGNEPMLKEQERQLEIKVRREEEHLATVSRKLEMAEVEEERRREKIAEMERKLSELKSDIAEAERDRSDARHQADIAQAEYRTVEEPGKASNRPGSSSPTPAASPSLASGGVLAAIINSTKSKPAFNLKPMGGPVEKKE